jgi:membrane protease subunit (stomatin/prohibitin family)
MGLFDAIKEKLSNEFVDIIEWAHPEPSSIVWKFPRYQDEIKVGAKLIVREGQAAVFLNEGQLADVFMPGTHTLETQNMPLLSTLKGWKYGFNSPFKADVFFVATKQFVDQKWGTKNPIMVRDAEFGPVRLRAFGSFAFKIGHPSNFIKNIAGAGAQFEVEDIHEQLRNLAITHGMDAIAESKIPVLDMAANQVELSKYITAQVQPEFAEIGLELTKFLVENISLPPEVEAMLDKRSSMGIIGDLNKFTQFQAANAIQDAAQNPNSGGMGAAGLSAGMGMAMMQNAQGLFGQSQVQSQQAPAQAPVSSAPVPPPLPGSVAEFFVAINGAQSGPFTQAQLQELILSKQLTPITLVWKQGMATWVAATDVPQIQALFALVPPPLPPTLG